jgi:hypothetical protein
LAKVYGEYPAYDETVYFLQTNCEILDITPEECSLNNPLDWNKGGEAVKVYVVKGTMTGANTFDLSDWQTGNGGVWENWYVDNGVLVEELGSQINCSSFGVNETAIVSALKLYPNPLRDKLSIITNKEIISIEIVDIKGMILFKTQGLNKMEINVNLSRLDAGIYFIKIKLLNEVLSEKFVKI